MDKGRTKNYPTGTKPHGDSIQIKFYYPKTAKKYTYKTIDWRPTPANLIKAGKIRKEIVQAVKHGTFNWADYFPDDPRACDRIVGTFFDLSQTWLDSPENDWQPQTRYKYKSIVQRVWIPALHDIPVDRITYKHISDRLSIAVKEHQELFDKEPSESLYNDWLTCVRGIFQIAVDNDDIDQTKNPVRKFKNKARVRPIPDPFDREETEAIIADIYKHDGNLWGAWFELGFFTGMRFPSEPAVLFWSAVDFNHKVLTIKQIYSKHSRTGIQKRTKTGVVRNVYLNTRAINALKMARRENPFSDDYVFHQKNGPVRTGDPQRAMWRASLKRLGIRYRDPYNMRHTYATFGLMSGANPAFMAKQLGHSIEEFFKTYATWIDRMNNDLQMNLIEQSISTNEPKMVHKATKNL